MKAFMVNGKTAIVAASAAISFGLGFSIYEGVKSLQKRRQRRFEQFDGINKDNMPPEEVEVVQEDESEDK